MILESVKMHAAKLVSKKCPIRFVFVKNRYIRVITAHVTTNDCDMIHLRHGMNSLY